MKPRSDAICHVIALKRTSTDGRVEAPNRGGVLIFFAGRQGPEKRNVEGFGSALSGTKGIKEPLQASVTMCVEKVRRSLQGTSGTGWLARVRGTRR